MLVYNRWCPVITCMSIQLAHHQNKDKKQCQMKGSNQQDKLQKLENLYPGKDIATPSLMSLAAQMWPQELTDRTGGTTAEWNLDPVADTWARRQAKERDPTPGDTKACRRSARSMGLLGLEALNTNAQCSPSGSRRTGASER